MSRNTANPEPVQATARRRRPTYQDGGVETERAMRQVLSDAASTVAESHPDLAAQLDRAVETLP